MKTYDVIALGELLVDLVQTGQSAQGNPLLEANPGGAPCNVLAMLAKLGCSTAFIGKVGRDSFGSQLKAALTEAGIAIEGLSCAPETPTTLAVVHTLPDGDREFSFYRSPGADMMLSKDDVDGSMLEDCRIFHFGSLSLTDEPSGTATKYAVERAKQSGAVISFDPNLRENLWNSLEDARREIEFGLDSCDFLKISDNEIRWLSGETVCLKGIAWLRKQYNIPLILMTMGKDGSYAFQGNKQVHVPGIQMPNTIETTGAGDTFCGCALHYIAENGWRDYTQEELREMLHFANAAAAIVTTRRGALRVMPTRQEILSLIEKNN